MRSFFALFLLIFSLNSFGVDSVKCSLRRAGYADYSYVTLYRPEGRSLAFMYLLGNGMDMYVPLSGPKLSLKDGQFVARIYGLDQYVEIHTSEDVLSAPYGEEFPATFVFRASKEESFCSRFDLR